MERFGFLVEESFTLKHFYRDSKAQEVPNVLVVLCFNFMLYSRTCVLHKVTVLLENILSTQSSLSPTPDWFKYVAHQDTTNDENLAIGLVFLYLEECVCNR